MNLIQGFRAFFFPERCPYCEELVEPDEYACKACREMLRIKQHPIKGGALGYRCISSFVYGGIVRRRLIQIKHHKRTQFIPQLAVILAKDIKAVYSDVPFDIITAVPMHRLDRYIREYNQAELLAKELSKLLDVPYHATLRKIKRTKQQHKLSYQERKKNLIGAFAVIDKELIKGQNILIVDDIITTGSTLGNCCKTLNKAHPKLLCCAAIASAQRDYPKENVI